MFFNGINRNGILGTLTISLCLLQALCLASCGRIGYPLAPEDLSAKEVMTLKASGTEDSILLTWQAPEIDQRGIALKSLDAYHVLRKQIVLDSDIIDEDIPFENIAELPDRYFSRLTELQDQARAKGLPTKRVQVEEEYRNYQFFDKNIEKGQRYIYQVVPINQRNVEGEVGSYIDVTYNGLQSSIEISENLLNDDDIN